MTATCPACGYNLPWHDTYCAERHIDPLALRLEVQNMDDNTASREICGACGHRLGCAKAKIADGTLVHRDLDCTAPGVW